MKNQRLSDVPPVLISRRGSYTIDQLDEDDCSSRFIDDDSEKADYFDINKQ